MIEFVRPLIIYNICIIYATAGESIVIKKMRFAKVKLQWLDRKKLDLQMDNGNMW